EKKKKVDAAQIRNKTENASHHTCHAVMTGCKVFTGSLQSKKKNELQDIAFGLQLPVDGTKDDIVTCIQRYLDKNWWLELDG
ncbi:hypothetical protein PAXRUDRAFT_135202, partial [Paxillus rubicundulus Ve08.2h10]